MGRRLSAWPIIVPSPLLPSPSRFRTPQLLAWPTGTFFPHVADGYWLMLAPLHAGQHTIQVYVYPLTIRKGSEDNDWNEK